MCGIFGLVQRRPFRVKDLAGMSRILSHRGPDDEGFAIVDRTGVQLYAGRDTPSASYDPSVSYCPRRSLPLEGHVGSGGIALGHRRLSILDLSSHGHQPMSYRQRYWISYNGEVYNYLELRSELEADGYTFSTRSDTEVILAAYHRWQLQCLSRLNGMWAIAIVDIIERKLVLARDRFGVKPLYLWHHGDRLAFASEIKAFAALEDWQPRANRQRLLDMLVWAVSDHTEQTMFEGVVQLPAGHHVSLELESACSPDRTEFSFPKIFRRWYSLPTLEHVPQGEAAESALRELLGDAVKVRLRADVPVGSCLSGGVDSSTIVCLLSMQLHALQTGIRPHTFTARSHDAEFDESYYARVVADHTAATLHEVTPEPVGLFDDLERMLWHQEEPFGSTSLFAQWCVFRLARECGVVVMLDGQGADEMLCGYRGFFGAYLAGMVRKAHLVRWLTELAAIRREIGFSRVRLAGYTAAYLAPRLLRVIGRLDGRAYADRGWLQPAAYAGLETDPIWSSGARASSIRDMSAAQIMATNLPMLLHWEDRNSMAFSVEARVPFLDYRVVELCINLPDSEKLGGGVSKSVLRRSMRGTVPDAILDRRDKLGFVTAERLWVTRDMAARFREELAEAVVLMREILSPAIIDRFDEVVAGHRAFDHRYWRAICAARWLRTFGVRL